MKKVKALLKIFLSLWIVYNIIVMLLMPNIGSYFGRQISRFIAPYAAVMGLNAGWNFFSPDPAHTMYLEYTLQYPDKEDGETREPELHFFPVEKNQPLLNPLRKRELYATRYMALDPKKLRVLFGPWLCRQHPGALTVDMRLIVETVPPLDKVVKNPHTDLSELSERLEFSHEFVTCGQQDEEVL